MSNNSKANQVFENSWDNPESKGWGATVKRLLKRYFIDAFTGMAQGLFVTLIAGTIFKQIATLIGVNHGFGAMLFLIGNFACSLMGAGIGVGIAKKLKAPDLVIFGCAVAGLVGAFLPDLAYNSAISADGFSLLAVATGCPTLKLGAPGNPIGAYVVTVIALECSLLVAGKTKLDILLIPLVILFSCFVSIFVAIPAVWLIAIIGKFIGIATGAQPFIMGVVIAVVMGVLLTMPTSSAAIWISLASPILAEGSGASPQLIQNMLLAGGAAVVGCSCQMVGYAVMSYRENKISGLISQGLGTSMLQIPNIMKHPQTLIPPVVASAILGPIATCGFKLYCNASGGGMGTSGLVGVFGAIAAKAAETPAWQMWLGIILLMFVLPAAISLGVCELMRKKGWIKPEYLKLPE